MDGMEDPAASTVGPEDVVESVGQHVAEALEAAVVLVEKHDVAEVLEDAVVERAVDREDVAALVDETEDPVASTVESEDVAESVGQHVAEALQAAVVVVEKQDVAVVLEDAVVEIAQQDAVVERAVDPEDVVALVDETGDPVASTVESEGVAESVVQHVAEDLEAAVVVAEQLGVVEKAVDSEDVAKHVG